MAAGNNSGFNVGIRVVENGSLVGQKIIVIQFSTWIFVNK